ncbi:MAG: hypothetical protein WBM43_00110 [Flavobacteriaceae bacterium]
MALQIRNKEGFIEVYGSLKSQNIDILRSYLETEFKSCDYLTLTLDKICGIDLPSAVELEWICKKASRMNQVLSIIGMKNIPVYQIMKTAKSDYILSHDRI